MEQSARMATVGTAGSPLLAPELEVRLYKAVLRIRRTEEILADRYKEKEMRTPTHFGTGQEAVAVGVCQALTEKDVVYTHHRCHNHYLAKGGDFFKGRGCGQCRQTGYKGRTVITEILEMTPEIKELIMKGGTSEEIKVLAHKIGLSTLRESAIRKALAGETTLEEVVRVTSEDQGMDREKDDKEKEKDKGKKSVVKEKAA